MTNKEFLYRKVIDDLIAWKNTPNHMPIIVKGARQIGKTEAIRFFAKKYYKSFIEINFIVNKQYKSIFDDGFDIDSIVKNISFKNPTFKFISGETLIFFDELQEYPNCATSLKFFKQDGRFDVICSGSLMGINYKEIESVSVGYKEDYEMHSMDFEEYLWAKGYTNEHINELLEYMLNVKPLPEIILETMFSCFTEHIVLGGMPAVVKSFITNKNYSGTLQMQRQLLKDYEEDAKKYAIGLDQAKILNVYRNIPVFLSKENKKFQISKVTKGARNRDYIGIVDWLASAGIINVCYCLNFPELPLKGNYTPNNYKIYFGDTGLLISSLDDEAQEDLRNNANFNIYKGAIYENIVSEILVKQGYNLYFYKNEKGTVEMDFFIRDKNSLIPIEVKAQDGATISLNNLIIKEQYPDVKYGIKFCKKNIDYNGNFYTFPYFLAFLIKKFIVLKQT